MGPQISYVVKDDLEHLIPQSAGMIGIYHYAKFM